MKIAALDTGDVWVGIALSDPMGIIAKPYRTVKIHELPTTIQTLIDHEKVSTFVIGHPKTLKGTSSDQTRKVEKLFQEFKIKFPSITFVLWDERFTSKQAEALKRPMNAEEKQKSHAIAAAFILQTYLQFRSMSQPSSAEEE